MLFLAVCSVHRQSILLAVIALFEGTEYSAQAQYLSPSWTVVRIVRRGSHRGHLLGVTHDETPALLTMDGGAFRLVFLVHSSVIAGAMVALLPPRSISVVAGIRIRRSLP